MLSTVARSFHEATMLVQRRHRANQRKEKLGGKLSDEETAKIEEVINEKIAWLEENADADADELKAQKKEMEDIVQPIIAKLYQGQGGAPPGEEGDEDDDEFKDEL